ncbi:MAG: OB-fold protein [Polyangiales bacterium]
MQPPYGYPPPPQYPYGPPPYGYPPQPPPPRGSWYHSPVVAVLLLLFCFPFGLIAVWTSPKMSQVAKIVTTAIWALFVGVGMASDKQKPRHASTEESKPAFDDKPVAKTKSVAAPAEPAEQAVRIKVANLLAEYKDNEVRADKLYKRKFVQFEAFVSETKRDFGQMYVILGTGAEFEFPQVQCFLPKDQEEAAADLTKGQKVTMEGRVDGLLFNVSVKDCRIVK